MLENSIAVEKKEDHTLGPIIRKITYGMKKTRLNEQLENKLRSKMSENNLQEGSTEIEQEDCQQCEVERLRQYDIRRQALHACRLQFPHPMTGEWMEFTAPLPEDMQRLL